MAKKTKSRDSRAENKMNLYEVYYFSGRQSKKLFQLSHLYSYSRQENIYQRQWRAKNLVTLKKRLKKEYSGYANIDDFLYKIKSRRRK